VPFLEKAYAKSHGSYQAISGGHIAEAFLDLTGAPTRVYRLLNDSNFEPRGFWYQLLSYHRQGLPMGCGTDSSAGGIIGMHAYSIIAVKEISGISPEFFQDKLLEGTLGNVR
jgi:calpain-15